MRRHFLIKGVPVVLAAMLVAAACSGGGESPTAAPTATPGEDAPTATSAAPAATPVPTAQPAVYTPPHERPGPAADRVFFKSFFVDRAPLDFQNGEMDFYLFGLKTSGAAELRGEPGIRLEEAPATTLSIVLNPAPAPEGQLNPFSIKEVRRAVQQLVDRDFIASDIYQGQALPMLTHLSPTDFDYLTVFEAVKESDYRFDPEFARDVIDRAMTAAGAEKIGGVWNFDGDPIRLKFIVRVEDERRAIGDLLRAELERAGFLVSPSYQEFAPAVLNVYSSDPLAFQWHLYTEGWSRGAPQRYDFGTINQMLAPWQGNMPGWLASGFWQYRNEELDDLGQRIFTGEFNGVEERNDLYRRMTEIGLDESVRVWVATVKNSFPVREEVEGVTSDLVAGPKTARSIREAYIPGKDELTLGSLWVWTERSTWNPIGGFGDLYSSDIFRHLVDPPISNHPFTGLPTPFRATFGVETAGPAGKLPIPTDAVAWDPVDNEWAPVEASQATSKVTFDFSNYFRSNWHHGQPITMADVMYSIAQQYEISFDPAKSAIEFALGATARPYLDTFRGYRIADGNTLEVYLDFWHFEESLIGSYASPSSLSTPWELLAAMDELVFEKRRAAYSDTTAARFSVPWISLAMKQDANLVERTLVEFRNDSFTPEGVFVVNGRSLVSEEEAAARYQAAIDWFGERDMLVIGNGPFFLKRYDPPAQFAELEAFRDPSYPYKPGDFYLGSAPRVDITRVEAGDVESGVDAEVSVEAQGPGRIGLRYVFFDPAAGRVVASGEADAGAGALTVSLPGTLTADLEPGLYQLFVAAYSDEIVSLTERRIDIEIIG